MNGIFNAGSSVPHPPKRVEPIKQKQQTRMTADEYQRRYGGAVKDPKRVYKGRNNQKNGKLFETMLNTACEKYNEEKVAKVSKTVEPFRIIGVLNVQPMVYKCIEEKEGEVDYKGIMASGQAIVFEAKSTEKDCIGWEVVREHQRNFLADYIQMNGIAFVMVSFGLKRFYRIPWWVWRDMKVLYGRKYLKPEDIPEFEIPMQVYFGSPAVLFLDGIESFWDSGKEVGDKV